MRGILLFALLFGLFASPGEVWARSGPECMTAWSRAVRSYLSQNRKATPDGKVPDDLDGEEMAAQAWMEAFRPACELEQSGDSSEARVQAALTGTLILARLDPQGCEAFLLSYMSSDRPRDICSAAGQGIDVRDDIARSIPER
ncbi:MAG: hypothetical protein AAGD10_08080 [Myxococcota bacterium]